ncbi:MAG: NADP-dependent oxidoreductase [Rhodospirillales bacterium]|nr:NADP-dependent oxidoreductase [Rhodospirillales bacterium]
MPKNRRILLKNRPTGLPSPSDFELVEGPVPEPGEGEVLTRTLFLSLDPYMRGRMSAAKSYAKPVELGQVMTGGTVGEVVASRHASFAPGDVVVGQGGWQDYAVLPGALLRKLDPRLAPVSTALGILGMPGMTAYVGLLDIGRPKPGETVVVSAASGAVGSVVGQIAKIHGCRVVGVAGGKAKTDYVVEELGFDAAVDHRSPDLADALAAACPKGVDIYFENVGGATQKAVWPLLNDFARVVVCGLIAHYNDPTPPPGPPMLDVLRKRLTVQGFIVYERSHLQADFLRDVGAWLQAGKLKYREDVVVGLENAPEAFIGLLQGKNFGKLVVKVA